MDSLGYNPDVVNERKAHTSQGKRQVQRSHSPSIRNVQSSKPQNYFAVKSNINRLVSARNNHNNLYTNGVILPRPSTGEQKNKKVMQELETLKPNHILFDLERLIEDHKKYEELVAKAQKENMGLEKQLQELKSQNEEIENQIAEHDSRGWVNSNSAQQSHLISSLKNQIKSLNSQIQEKELEIDATKKSVKYTKIQELDTELEIVTEEYQRLHRIYNKILENEGKNTIMHNENDPEEEFYIRQNLLTTLQKENEEIENENNLMEEELSNLKKIVESLMKQKRNEEETSKKIKQKIKDKEKEITLLKEEILARTSVNAKDGKRTLIIGPNEQNLREEIKNKQKENDSLKEKITTKKKTLEDLQKKFREMQEEHKSRLDRDQADNQKLQKELDELRKTRDQKHEEKLQGASPKKIDPETVAPPPVKPALAGYAIVNFEEVEPLIMLLEAKWLSKNFNLTQIKNILLLPELQNSNFDVTLEYLSEKLQKEPFGIDQTMIPKLFAYLSRAKLSVTMREFQDHFSDTFKKMVEPDYQNFNQLMQKFYEQLLMSHEINLTLQFLKKFLQNYSVAEQAALKSFLYKDFGSIEGMSINSLSIKVHEVLYVQKPSTPISSKSGNSNIKDKHPVDNRLPYHNENTQPHGNQYNLDEKKKSISEASKKSKTDQGRKNINYKNSNSSSDENNNSKEKIHIKTPLSSSSSAKHKTKKEQNYEDEEEQHLYSKENIEIKSKSSKGKNSVSNREEQIEDASLHLIDKEVSQVESSLLEDKNQKNSSRSQLSELESDKSKIEKKPSNKFDWNAKKFEEDDIEDAEKKSNSHSSKSNKSHKNQFPKNTNFNNNLKQENHYKKDPNKSESSEEEQIKNYVNNKSSVSNNSNLKSKADNSSHGLEQHQHIDINYNKASIPSRPHSNYSEQKNEPNNFHKKSTPPSRQSSHNSETKKEKSRPDSHKTENVKDLQESRDSDKEYQYQSQYQNHYFEKSNTNPDYKPEPTKKDNSYNNSSEEIDFANSQIEKSGNADSDQEKDESKLNDSSKEKSEKEEEHEDLDHQDNENLEEEEQEDEEEKEQKTKNKDENEDEENNSQQQSQLKFKENSSDEEAEELIINSEDEDN